MCPQGSRTSDASDRFGGVLMVFSPPAVVAFSGTPNVLCILQQSYQEVKRSLIIGSAS